MSSSKRLPCQKEACAIQKCLQGNKLSNFVSYQSCCTRKILYVKKFKVNFVINLIKRKLILMSVLFWPETRNVDLVDHKNSYIGAACQVRLLVTMLHFVAGRLAAADFIQGPVHTNGPRHSIMFFKQFSTTHTKPSKKHFLQCNSLYTPLSMNQK